MLKKTNMFRFSPKLAQFMFGKSPNVVKIYKKIANK